MAFRKVNPFATSRSSAAPPRSIHLTEKAYLKLEKIARELGCATVEKFLEEVPEDARDSDLLPTIEVDADIYEKLRHEAAGEGISIREYIADLYSVTADDFEDFEMRFLPEELEKLRYLRDHFECGDIDFTIRYLLNIVYNQSVNDE